MVGRVELLLELRHQVGIERDVLHESALRAEVDDLALARQYALIDAVAQQDRVVGQLAPTSVLETFVPPAAGTAEVDLAGGADLVVDRGPEGGLVVDVDAVDAALDLDPAREREREAALEQDVEAEGVLLAVVPGAQGRLALVLVAVEFLGLDAAALAVEVMREEGHELLLAREGLVFGLEGVSVKLLDRRVQRVAVAVATAGRARDLRHVLVVKSPPYSGRTA